MRCSMRTIDDTPRRRLAHAARQTLHAPVVASARNLYKGAGDSAMDLAKRLLDYGFHAPTVYFPLVVAEAMMMNRRRPNRKKRSTRFPTRFTRSLPGSSSSTTHTFDARQPAGRRSSGPQADPQMGTVRVVIESEPQTGVRNMANDEALWKGGLGRGECTVRWYRWSVATVSLGYFQAADAATRFPNCPACRSCGDSPAAVRFCITTSGRIPARCRRVIPWPNLRRRSSGGVHERVVSSVGGSGGIHAALAARRLPNGRGVLCFGRGDPRDIVIAGQKILGSAPRVVGGPCCSTAAC